MNKHILEPAAWELAQATSKPPFLYELGPEGARKVLDDLQTAPIAKPDVDEKWIVVPAGVGNVRVRIVKPVDSTGTLPVVLYVHGGGWVIGNAGTHDRLVRELAAEAGAAVVFVEYDRSPEARHPVAIEQPYATAQWIVKFGAEEELDPSRLAVAGDSVGGNMTAALTILAKQRGDVHFVRRGPAGRPARPSRSRIPAPLRCGALLRWGCMRSADPADQDERVGRATILMETARKQPLLYY